MKMTFGSLFAGIGGFDLGLERAGMECRWQVEIDDHATRTLQRHWPAVRRYHDVRECGRHNLESVDLVCGGFPCQDVSVAGGRAGLAGERSGLWFEFLRVLEETRPQWVIIENVPGLLSSNGGRDFATVLRGLAECGYLSAWRVLDAQYFGLAQRRRRVFVVGCLGDGRAAEVCFEREGGAGDTAAGGEAGEGIAGTLGNRITRSHTELDGHGAYVFEPRFTRNGRGAPDVIAPPLKAQSGRTGKGDGAPVVAFTDRTRDGMKVTDWQEDLSYSLNSPGQGGRSDGHRVAGFFDVRRLTPMECERLQGFPDGWTAGQSDSARYRQLGNAVAVPVVEWLGKRLIETIK